MKWLVALALAIGCAGAPAAHAAVRAWVVPERVALGDTTTLNIESDDAGAQPDFQPLAKDFELRGTSSSTQMSFVNGQGSTKVLYAVVLEPREAGTFTIPSLAVGNARTNPIALTVLPSLPASAQRGDAVYMEAEVDTATPYVQQAVLYTIRLHFAVTLVDGAIDARTPDNATSQQLGQDRQYEQTEGNGRTYRVLERRFVLVPERSGRMELPAPRFRGRGLSGMDPFTRGGNVSAVGPALALDVKPAPADAPQPWLPAAGAKLTRNDVPTSAQAGEPVTIDIALTVDGALASQLPDVELPPVPGAQVFPEPQQRSDALAGSALQATLRRRFAIVPNAAGRLEIPAVRVRYWNTTTDRADVAELAPLVLDVAPGAATAAAPADAAAPVAAPNAAAGAGESRELRWWQGLSAALGFALAIALGLLWAQSRSRAAVAPPRTAGAPAQPGHGALRRALVAGDLRDIAAALVATVDPPAASLGVLASRLDDAAQRAAVVRLERALWAAGVDKGEREGTRDALRAAFRDGPKLARTAGAGAPDAPLPPLYPAR
ncbi:MAG TPA: BatD family protein [Xanthomonadales bacterium]|nr:BatD family protein [Xanthomonadales bacterium]